MNEEDFKMRCDKTMKNVVNIIDLHDKLIIT